MEITEEKIRQITQETQRILGAHAHPEMVKKVVKEVVRRLMEQTNSHQE
ncbi:hypothetical protein GWO43_02525 [candidate division KSB1 bacterium]|nr:hypothetical protein [candidate division KSB1 bacterium]NIR69741.1 hypothetical protein [candidate division KSB1 bacterium]NIS22929.1 hypothetical protein [candidate division KSB1 bacterium]NIT69786.1 hypothetical protein [candidate division KSB1 bacterium]NIU23460.1 hypothetical protein [candidate division KSB1 bacterium]